MVLGKESITVWIHQVLTRCLAQRRQNNKSSYEVKLSNVTPNSEYFVGPGLLFHWASLKSGPWACFLQTEDWVPWLTFGCQVVLLRSS
eukprot:3702639-Amphidinium_carterae.1